MMQQMISDSRFHMWRAVIAMIHVDDVVRPHEINFILENLKDLNLSEEQRATLNQDLKVRQDVQAMFDRIGQEHDIEDFFHFARAVSWADGDFHDDEKSVLSHIGHKPLKQENADLLRQSLSNFKGLYIDASVNPRDHRFASLIMKMIDGKPQTV